ncbi:hypothetical protein CNC00705 [Cryptococcus deneoformans JEC21]|uniref:HIT domain-containing protein n=1 Tax=Cryptococcus deneoformans (strain JEC21 / ATCC MYA-565) TaxID=214684 RepID=A0A0S2LIA0_CRYD1|nr:hypothetical protein CNC00705 [Cryptococcus neoformans var. neoformans JEC21]ALO60439.1 hypothetical protein CNC00705 [Cryptococcus neoformans var. neoformans JEC21]
MPKFLSCFPSQRSAAAQYDPLLPTSNDITNDADNHKKTIASCIFCDVSRDKDFNIVYEDQELIAFHDRTPRAVTHLLIIPRSHVASSVRQLTHEHLPLIQWPLYLAHLCPPNRHRSWVSIYLLSPLYRISIYTSSLGHTRLLANSNIPSPLMQQGKV